MTKNMFKMNKLSKEEIKKNREEFKKDPVNFLLRPDIEMWRESPLRGIGVFLMWVLIMYSIFVILQAVYYDTIYCDSNLDEYDGKVMDTFNPFIGKMNELILDNVPVDENYINCTHDFSKWWKEDKDILINIKRIGIDRWKME